VASTSDDDQLMSLRELAGQAGVAEGTLRNWARRHEAPLRVHRLGPRAVRVGVVDLRAFCATHRTLPGTKKVLARLDDPSAASEPAALRTLLLAVATAVRAATAANLNLTRTSTGQAENTAAACRTHAEELTAALNGLDDALRALTPPTTSTPSLGG
jgi:hypothetical protein